MGYLKCFKLLVLAASQSHLDLLLYIVLFLVNIYYNIFK